MNKISANIINRGIEHINKNLSENEMVSEPFVKLNCIQSKYHDEFQVFLSLDKDFIANGGIRDLSPTALKVLLVIACHTNNEGFSWISQERIGELVGLSRQQVGKVINSHLLNKEFDGRVLLKGVKLQKDATHTICVYHPLNCHVDKIFVDPDHELFDDAGEYIDEMDVLPL